MVLDNMFNLGSFPVYCWFAPAVFVPAHEMAEVDVVGHDDEDDGGIGGEDGDMVQAEPLIVQPAHHLLPPGEAGGGRGGRHVGQLLRN